jgi:hypothetical protein
MKILIEKCEVTVPRRGQQQERSFLQEEFRQQNPEAATDFESQPWYVDPDGPAGADDVLTIRYEWSVDGHTECWQSFFPLQHAVALRQFVCGPVVHCREDEAPTIEYSYPLTASFALAMLQRNDILPMDAVLANQTDLPVCCEEQREAA